MPWVLWGQLSALGVAAVAGALGYMRLARLLGSEVLTSSYVALVLYAGVRVGDGLLGCLLRAWPARVLFLVRYRDAVLRRRGSAALRWLAVGYWAYVTLDALELIPPIWSAVAVVLETRYVRGSVSLSLGDVVTFALTVGAGFFLAAVVRVVLHEDVYPRVRLPRGVAYAVSTLVRYAIVLGTLSSRRRCRAAIRGWSLTSLQQRLFKTGGRLIRHARFFVLQPAESYLTGSLFRQILGRIERLVRHRRDLEPVQGAGALSGGGDAAAMSLNGTVRVTNREAPGSHRPQASSEGRPSSCREGRTS
jgi:hypothetical protein